MPEPTIPSSFSLLLLSFFQAQPRYAGPRARARKFLNERCESGHISFHGTVDFQRVGVGPKAERTKFHWRPERFLLEGRSDLPMPVN